MESATKEIFICTTVSDFEDKSRALVPVIEKALKNNIKVKLALSGEAEKIKKLTLKHNLKSKIIESNARIFMVDRKEALFMITAQNSDEEIGIWLNSPFFTDSMTDIIDNALRNQFQNGNSK